MIDFNIMGTERAVLNDGSVWGALFSPSSIAVIGANEVLGSWGSDATRAALEAARVNPQRRAYPVNPTEKQVMGAPCYPTINDVPDVVDLAIIVVRSTLVPAIMRQCVEKRVKAAVIISAGFAETDEAGARLEAEVVQIARQGGIRLVGPNCIGHADVTNKVGALGIGWRTRPGPMAIISQSGTVSAGIMGSAGASGIGISKFISTGNEADLHTEDYLEFLAKDPPTRLIGAYIEGLREGRRFFELAREITLTKPIVVIKAGGTEGSGRAARSHTSALAGSDVVYSAAFRQAGVIRVEDEESLCDIALALLTQPLPRGNTVGILTIGGGMGVMAAESCERDGLKMATLQPETLAKLDAVLPPRWSHGNPIDMVGIKTMDEFPTIMTCLKALVEDPNVDSVVSLVTARNYGGDQFREVQAKAEQALADLTRTARQMGKPFVVIRRMGPPPSMMNGGEPPPANLEDRIPEYGHPRRAARVLGQLMRYRQYLERRRPD